MLQKGGWAMIPLGGLSVLTGMLVVGFAVTIRRGTVASRQYLATVEVLIRKKDYLGVLAVSNRHGEALARVVQRSLDFATKNPGVPYESLKEVAAGLQLSRLAFAWKIGLPSTLPDILAGMRLSMTVSLIVAVVGEMIASQPGLGQAILLAARSFRASELFAGIVLLGALGFLSNALLASLEHRLLRWQRP
jgi:hypothetical protein